MTPLGLHILLGKREEKNISQRISVARGRWVSNTRAWKQVHSLVVKALTCPPDGVHLLGQGGGGAPLGPLEYHVLNKWAAPFSLTFSWREPVPTQMPSAAERTPGTRFGTDAHAVRAVKSSDPYNSFFLSLSRDYGRMVSL